MAIPPRKPTEIEKLSDIDLKLGKHSKKIEKQIEKLGLIDNKMGQQTQKLSNIDAKLANQIDKLGGIGTKVSEQTAKLGGVDAKLGDHSKKLDDQTAKLGSMDAKLAQQVGKLNSIQGVLGQQTGKLDGIRGEINQHTGKLGEIETSLGTHGGKLDEQTAKLGGIDAKLADQIGKLGGIGTKIGEQTQRLGSIDTKLGQLGDQTVKLGNIDNKLGEHTNVLTGIKGVLGDHTGKLTEQTGKLGSIDGKLGEHTGKLGAIESKLGNLEAGLAPPVTLSMNAQGGEVGALQGKLAKLGVPIPQHETNANYFGLGTQSALIKIQEMFRLPRTGTFDEATNAVLAGMVTGAEAKQRVDGRLFFQDGRPASGITLRLYKRNFGGSATKIKDFTSDSGGFYTLEHDDAEKNLNLEVRAVDPDDPQKDYPLALTKHSAGKQEMMNLLVPTSLRKLDPEYDRLSAGIEKQIGNIAKLKDAQESDNQRDLTLLHRSTGWDARLIGLAATAAKLSSSTGLDQGVLYAMFRAGLPTDQEQLARLGSVAVQKALGKAAKARIIALNNQQIAEAKGKFEGFARKARRELKLAGTASSFGDFLKNSGLVDDAQKSAFEDVYFARRNGDSGFWSAVGKKLKDTGLDQSAVEEKVKGLRLQGKLGYLSLNSSELTETLKSDITDPDQMAKLVDLGLYNDQAWKDKLTTAAGGDNAKLEEMIPTAYVGDDVNKRLDGYAADLARKVRLSFPTQIVSCMIHNDEMILGPDHATMKAPVHGFLDKAQKLGFELGRNSVEAFVREHKAVLFDGGASDDEVAGIVKIVKNVQRIYQSTPTNEAMKILLELGFTSALDVLAFPYAVFLERFGRHFPSIDQARLVYRKAEQVNAVTHSFFSAAKQLDSSPGVHALSPPTAEREKAKTELIKRFPTMETLFGSLDYCECEHCRSVLSPAAYLVDLLQFLEPEDLVWQSFLNVWKKKHDNKEYVENWKRPDGSTPPPLERKPYHALIERRPDLPHLPLTCENTHTALPYIDVVNEILEYYVAHGKLKSEAAHDTGSATSEELLAEPQNILPKAYEELNHARYPLAWISLDTPAKARLGLPFDLWIETVRRFLEYFEVDLAEVLKAFRNNDALFHADGGPYGYASVFVESLGLSPTDFSLLSAADPLADWYALYGFEDQDETLNGVKKDGLVIPDGAIDRFDHYSTPPVRFAKALSRHLGVTYKEVIELVQTSFINPKLDSLTFLRKLEIDVREVFCYNEHAGYPKLKPEEKTAFETRVLALSKKYGEAVFGNQDALAWLNASWDQGNFNDVLLLAEPSVGCDFDAAVLRYADGRPAEPLDYLKINLFVRLWRKLGWTIEEVDHALQVFLPSDLRPLTDVNLGAALKTAIVYFAAIEELGDRLSSGNEWRRKLLTFWSDLSTTGKKPLYEELFLTASVLKDDKDKVFDNPLGKYLQFEVNKEPLLKDHLLTIQAALGITADDIGQILQDARRDALLKKFYAGDLTAEEVQKKLTEEPPAIESEKLSLGTVSLLYRYGLLGKGLKLSVPELIMLKVLSGIDPFRLPEATELADIEKNHPFKQTLRLADIAEALKKTALSIEELDYLLRHQFDPVGKHRSDAEDLRLLIGNLAAGLQRIDQEHPFPTDKESLTEEFLREHVTLLLGADKTDEILGTLSGTISYEADPEMNVASAEKLNLSDLSAEARIQVSFVPNADDRNVGIQKLSFRGILRDPEKLRLKKKAH
jgi:peptidoglycan hydrolase-like protein with peptidoglycan-binding domain